MRKSFTRFFGLLLIILVSLSGYAQTYKPVTGGGAATLNLKLTQEFSVTFAGAVTASGTKFVRLYNDVNNDGLASVADDVPLFVQPATDHEIIVSGSKVTFNFNQYLAEGKSYYIAYDAGAFIVGGTPQGAVAQATWTFAIGDWTAPKLAATAAGVPFLPVNQAINVEEKVIFDPIKVTFNEAIALGTPVLGNGTGIYLMEDDGTAYGNVVEVLTAPQIAIAGAAMTLTPTAANWKEKTKYYILIEEGAVRDVSVNSNKFAGFVDNGKLFADKTWGFTTADMTAPVVNPINATTTKTEITVSITVNEKGKVWVDRALTGGGVPTVAALKASATAQLLSFTAAGTQTVTWTVPAAQAAVYDIFYVSETNINYTGTTEITSAVGTKTPVNLKDGVSPTLDLATPFTPANDPGFAFPVAKTQKYTLKFSEGVKIAATGNVYLRKVADNTNAFSGTLASVGTVKNSAGTDKKLVEIDFPDFASEGRYYIIVEAGAVTDLNDNPFAGVLDLPGPVHQWNLVCVDYLAPVFAHVPATNANVNPGGVITFTFNEAIRHSSGVGLAAGTPVSVSVNGLDEAFELYENGTKVAHTWAYTAPNTITLAPTVPGTLKNESTYRVIFYPYWIEDASGNEIASPVDFSFTTKDVTAPQIQAYGPATVGETSNLTITFTEPIRWQDATAVTNANVANLITLKQWGGTNFTNISSDQYVVTINDAKTVITVNPAFSFPSSGNYRLSVGTNLEDMSGNNLNVSASFPLVFPSAPAAPNAPDRDFTVADYVPPVATLTPANGANVNPAGLTPTLTVSEAVARQLTNTALNGTEIILREGGVNGVDVPCTVAGGPLVYTYTPVAPYVFKSATTYYFAVEGALRDAAGNVNLPKSSTFTTMSTTAPNLIDYTVSPALATTLNPATSAITVTFAEPVVLVAANNTLPTVADDVSADLNSTACTLSNGNKTLTIPHAAFNPTASGLPDNNNVVVTIPAGVLTAQDGTAMTGAITWSFGSQDNTAPKINVAGSGLTPALVGVGGVPPVIASITTNPVIDFNEDVTVTDGAYVEVRYAASTTIVQTLTKANGRLVVNHSSNPGKDKVTILLNAPLDYNTGYYILVPNGAIKDLGGNSFAGLVNAPADGEPLSWDFTTPVTPGALTIDVAKSSPTLYQDGVALDADLTVDFNRNLSQAVNNTLNWVVYQIPGYNSLTGAITAGAWVIADQYSTVDPSMTISGDKVIINPTNNLTANKWYVIRFSDGFVKDTYTPSTSLTGASAGVGGAAGNMDYILGLNPSDIIFHTGSAQGPIASFFPANAAKDVLPTDNITVTFNEAFYTAGGAAITTAMIEGGLITVVGTVSGAHTFVSTISGNSIIIDPVLPFSITPENVTVTVVNNSFFDINGNTYDKTMGDGVLAAESNQTATFTTVDQTGPVAAIPAVADAPNPAYPKATNGTTMKYHVSSTEKGFVYSVVLPTPVAPAVAPTAAEIKANPDIITTISTVAPATSAVITKTGLTPGKSYTIYAVAIDNATSPNTGAVVASAAIWTLDDVAPSFVARVPATSPAAQTTAITIEYNEPIAANFGYLYVRDKATQNVVAAWDVTALAGTSNINTVPKKATFNLGGVNGELIGVLAAWDSETTYSVYFDPGAVKDLPFAASVPASGNNVTTTPVVFEFTVKDWVVPTYTASSPLVSVAGGAVPEHNGQSISITFSENMVPTATLIRVYEDRGLGYPGAIIPNNEIETIDPNTVSWNATNTKATFSISHFLLKEVEEYYVVVDNACFKDDGNNNPSWAASAYTTGKILQFKTPDQKTLAATHTFVPAPTALFPLISPTANIVVDFNTDQVVWSAHPFPTYLVNANTDSIVSLYDSNGVKVPVATTIGVSVGTGDVFTINPVAKLKDFSTYTVKITPVEDVNGNKVTDLVAAGCEFTFQTGDGTAPVITFNPLNKTVETPKAGPFYMYVDEPLYANTGLVFPNHAQVINNDLIGQYVVLQTAAGVAIPHTATISADYKTITITPTANIASETLVRYGFKTAPSQTVSDYQGNVYNAGAYDNIIATATNSAVTFAETRIMDYSKPTVVAYTPAPGTPITTTGLIRMRFVHGIGGGDIVKGTGNLYIRELVSGNIIETIPAANVTVVNNDVALGDYITIPHAALPANTQFYVTIDEGFVTDNSPSLNKYAGISDINSTVGKTWTFNTQDLSGPAVKTKTPAPLAIDVLLDQKLQIIFDQPVQAGAGNIVIYEKDGTPYDIIPIGNAKVDFNAQYAVGGGDTIVTISHTKFLDNSEYFVRIDNGAITDKAVPVNAWSGILDNSWSFKTEDYTPAVFTIVSPLDNATAVDMGSTFQLTFNRAITKGTGKIQLWKRAGDVKIQEIDVTNSAVTVSATGMSASFTFPEKMPEGTELYVIIQPNVFVNASIGHVPFGGITEQWTWNFTTGFDGTAPTLVSVSPDAKTGLKPADVKLELTLSEDVAAGTGNIVIYNAATDAIVESIAIGTATIAGPKVTVTPTALAEQKSYYVLVDAGAIKDKAVTPNVYAGITDKTRWTFATGDFTAPTKVSVEPNATTITLNHPILVLTMNEAVKLTTTGGSVTITKVGATTASVTIPLTAAMISADGKVITITYVAAGAVGLDKNTDYFVTVPAGALEDNAGNDFAGITTATAWTFKTGTGFATGNDPVLGSLEFKVYPNPFVNELKVDNASELSRIIITSMTGQKVKEIVNPTSTIQTNELRSGVYFISLYVDDVVAKTERIVKR